MKFLLLLTGDEDAWDQASAAERAELMRRVAEFDQRHSGLVAGGGALAPAAQARTVRRVAGAPAVTDGPYGETKEVVGGFIVIEAAGIDEAVAVAGQFPYLPGASGGVEVRQLLG